MTEVFLTEGEAVRRLKQGDIRRLSARHEFPIWRIKYGEHAHEWLTCATPFETLACGGKNWCAGDTAGKKEAQKMYTILLVEDNDKLRPAMKAGLENTGQVEVVQTCRTGQQAIDYCLNHPPDVILMDVQLDGPLNGIEAAVAIRREFPRHPVVFYSIQDDDTYYRDFLQSGILSHYAYVRKSNYLLPGMIVPLLHDAFAGRSFIDPDVESRVHEVRHKDRQSPMALLEPNEQEVARMLAQGMSNEQIASQMGFRDKRTISRINGQIYTAWGLNETATDEKIARTRVAIIVNAGRLIRWDDDGRAYFLGEQGEWEPWER